MRKLNNRIVELEAKHQNRPFVETPEFRADFELVLAFWHACGENVSVVPPDEMTDAQKTMLTALIKLKRFIG